MPEKLFSKRIHMGELWRKNAQGKRIGQAEDVHDVMRILYQDGMFKKFPSTFDSKENAVEIQKLHNFKTDDQTAESIIRIEQDGEHVVIKALTKEHEGDLKKAVQKMLQV